MEEAKTTEVAYVCIESGSFSIRGEILYISPAFLNFAQIHGPDSMKRWRIATEKDIARWEKLQIMANDSPLNLNQRLVTTFFTTKSGRVGIKLL
jgi:hypothetical protein